MGEGPSRDCPGSPSFLLQGGRIEQLPIDKAKSAWEKDTVTMVRVDEHIDDHIHFMKIDCQGYELDALQGILDRNRARKLGSSVRQCGWEMVALRLRRWFI